MPTVTRSSYSLRQFTSSSDKDFAEALSLYMRYTPPAVRTSTNEIAYWVDNAGEYQKNKFLVLGFYCGKNIIGFSEMAYLWDSKVLVIDYLAIEPSFRKNNVFFEFIEHARSFIADLRLDVLYIVTEIGKFSETVPPDSSRALVRLLKFAGFKVAKTLYYQPQLGEKNADSEMEAILMVYFYGDPDGTNNQSSLTKATFLQIVRGIYFEHYLRWYEPHVDHAGRYKSDLERLLKKIDSSIKKPRVELNGHHYLLETGSAETAPPQKDATRIAALTTGFVALIALIVALLSRFLDMPSGVFLIVFLVVFTAFIGITASRKESPTVVFKELVRLVRSVLRIGA